MRFGFVVKYVFSITLETINHKINILFLVVKTKNPVNQMIYRIF